MLAEDLRSQNSGRNRMIRPARSLAIAMTLFGSCALLPVEADAFELSGAWASQADLCNLVFTKKGGKVAFAELSDLYGSGFVIDGNHIRGKAAQCTIQSNKQEGDTIEL